MQRFIVVCPSSLVQNWAIEFDKWVGKAQQPKRSVILEGGESCAQRLRSFVPIKPNLSESKFYMIEGNMTHHARFHVAFIFYLNLCLVLIISYDLFRINAALITQANEIGLLVVDEGHRLKNASGLTMTALSSLRCDARLLITGTIFQNNLSEFYTLVNFTCPGILGSSSEFRKGEF